MSDEANQVGAGRFWEAGPRAGRRKKYETPADLRAACIEYFEWVADNPIVMAKPFNDKGTSWNHEVPMMRAATQAGMLNFLGIGQSTWSDYKLKHGPEFREVVDEIDSYIYQQKFEGAAAGLLNPVIIARDLGLAEKQEHSNPDGTLRPESIDKKLVSALVKKLTE